MSFVSCFCLFAQTEGNKAFQLNVNNGDAYLDCGDVSELNNTSQYTIEMWVNVTLNDLPDRFIIFKKEPIETNRIKVQVEKNGQIYVMQSNGGDGAFAQTPVGTYPESGWHHIALVYDGEKRDQRKRSHDTVYRWSEATPIGCDIQGYYRQYGGFFCSGWPSIECGV